MTKDLYIQDGNVYCGTRQLPIKEQRGRRYVHYNGRQVNIKTINELQVEQDPVFEYLFNRGHIDHPCHAMNYWIRRWRLKEKITAYQYKLKYIA